MYLSSGHEERYNSLLVKANVYAGDTERRSLFYILAGNEDLYKNVNKIYNFNDSQINIEITEDNNFIIPGLIVSSSARALAYLAIQLYNSCNQQSIMETFSNLDSTNFKLALNAIKLRFNM